MFSDESYRDDYVLKCDKCGSHNLIECNREPGFSDHENFNCLKCGHDLGTHKCDWLIEQKLIDPPKAEPKTKFMKLRGGLIAEYTEKGKCNGERV
jgi:Fe2+ or Zn2+ uptake regulation protein